MMTTETDFSDLDADEREEGIDITPVVEGGEPVSLADAAQDALESMEDGGDEQIPLVPACKVKFVGMAWDSLDTVPALRDELQFVVKGVVVGHGQEVLANGEIRETAKVKVTGVTLS